MDELPENSEVGGLRVRRVVGAAIAERLDAVAALRLQVFRDWPYLYEGTAAEEREYLAAMAQAPSAVCVLAIDAEAGVVGASTAMLLRDEHAEFRRPFEEARTETGIEPDRVFYLAESVLLPAYRGRGIGKAFFAHREAHAGRLNRAMRDRGEPGIAWLAFCAVDRPLDHPMRPAGYRPLDGFWQRCGYERRPGLRAEYAWRDVGEAEATVKRLTFWVKRMDAEA